MSALGFFRWSVGFSESFDEKLTANYPGDTLLRRKAVGFGSKEVFYWGGGLIHIFTNHHSRIYVSWLREESMIPG